jgi:hypothetical protein
MLQQKASFLALRSRVSRKKVHHTPPRSAEGMVARSHQDRSRAIRRPHLAFAAAQAHPQTEHKITPRGANAKC